MDWSKRDSFQRLDVEKLFRELNDGSRLDIVVAYIEPPEMGCGLCEIKWKFKLWILTNGLVIESGRFCHFSPTLRHRSLAW